MEMNEKIDILAELFDRDAEEIKPETNLDELGWDSMTMLSVIAMAKTRFNKTITGAQIRGFLRVQGILNEME